MTIWLSELLSKQEWVAHGTATLAFGSTRYPNAGEEDANVENRAKFLRALGLDPSRLVASENVHGKSVSRVSPPSVKEGLGVVLDRIADCDGLVTTTPSIVLATKTADCLPIFIADPTTRTVAIVHAGWKGVMAGIAIEAVRAFVDHGSFARDLIVAIGPSIGPCHYVIHGERRDEMLATTPFVREEDFVITTPNPSLKEEGRREYRVDLRAIVVRQLVSSGVLATNIDASAPCTACHPDRFASYFLSRDMSQGMLSAIAIRPTVD